MTPASAHTFTPEKLHASSADSHTGCELVSMHCLTRRKVRSSLKHTRMLTAMAMSMASCAENSWLYTSTEAACTAASLSQ